jgi:hypothetical protein
MRIHVAVILLALVGCSKSKDECAQLTDKMRPTMTDLAKERGKTLTDDDFAKMADKCRTSKSDKMDADKKCILDAKDDAAVRACMTSGMENYKKRSQATESTLMLNKLGKNSKVFFITNAMFVTGKAGPTPATPCCSAADHKCPAEATQWTGNPVWSALDFQIDEPNLYQYTYESDGKTFTATATGDLNCDGHPTTIKIDGKADNGDPTFTPPPGL